MCIDVCLKKAEKQKRGRGWLIKNIFCQRFDLYPKYIRVFHFALKFDISLNSGRAKEVSSSSLEFYFQPE